MSFKIQNVKVITEKVDAVKMADALAAVRPLFLACQHGEKQKLEQLIGKGIVDVMNDTMSLLHCAVEQAHMDIIQMLVHRGATLDVMDINGATPLHYAIKIGHLPITKFLDRPRSSCRCSRQ